jgi:hypothetical protein
MNRTELVAFLNENYAEDEVLVWQTICKTDIEMMLNRTITEEQWEGFVEKRHMGIAEMMSDNSRMEADDYFEALDEEGE